MISANYLLLAIPPYYEDTSGGIWVDELWFRDLVTHLDYIENLTILSEKHPKPIEDQVDGSPLVKVPEELRGSLHFSPLPRVRSGKQAPLNFLGNVPRLWRLIRRTDIVHSGVAGWPYPLGLIANPLSRMMKKKLVIIVESSPWRLSNPRKASRINKIRERLNERFAIWSVKKADLAVFTSPGYLETLGEPENGEVLITPANWVKKSDIISQNRAADVLKTKTGVVKFICPTRLTPDKGLPILLAALDKLEEAKVEVQLDIIGQGELSERIEARLKPLTHVKTQLLPPVPYGEAFFSLLQKYDALIAPTLGDEQPRIIFDAYSQGLPVIASNTPGQEFLVDEGQTGAIYWRTDPEDLARAITNLTTDRAWLGQMGMNALAYASEQTHEAMHARRAVALQEMLSR